ncbi:MAG TPA: hypothetical protein VF450_17815 [Noviherbaspirillum sp.]
MTKPKIAERLQRLQLRQLLRPVSEPCHTLAEKPKAFVEKVKPWLDLIQTCLTILGIFCATAWFLMQGSYLHRVNDSIKIEDRKLDGTDFHLMHITASMENIGLTPTHARSARAAIHLILPNEKSKIFGQLKSGDPPHVEGYATKINWDKLENECVNRDIYLKPGEKDFIEWDFLLNDLVKTVKVDVSIAESDNCPENEFAWHSSALYDVGAPARSDGKEK